jgi:hypothetical protein
LSGDKSLPLRHVECKNRAQPSDLSGQSRPPCHVEPPRLSGTKLLGVRSLLVLITVGLLGVACGGETTATPSAATPTATKVKASAAPVVLSGVGKATEPPPQRHATDAGTVRLGPGAYKVSWLSPDQSFFLFCGLASATDYGITIGLAREPDNPKLVEDLVGGDYQCQVSAQAGTTWTVTFSPA